MIKVEILCVNGFEEAVHGMRNPMNSWNKSDSAYCFFDCSKCDEYQQCSNKGSISYNIGQNDMNLMKNLFKAGSEHRKYDRMIQVYMDITAPLYWWKEFDTYKIGTVANSCSTMHKIHSKEFTLDDFSHEHLCTHSEKTLIKVIENLNIERKNYLISKDKYCWWQMIQLLPSSYNQKRTVMMNYEVCARIIEQRKNHKLDEWLQFVDILKQLPYMKDIIGE